jgi:hypothetical protein
MEMKKNSIKVVGSIVVQLQHKELVPIGLSQIPSVLFSTGWSSVNF